MVNRSSRLSKNLTDIFGSRGGDECRVCTNPLGNPRRKYCCDRCQRVAYAVIRLYRWERVREYVLERDGHACTNPECDATDDTAVLHVDHIVPLADDGPAHDPTNLQTLCEACNTRKGTSAAVPSARTATCPDCGQTFIPNGDSDRDGRAGGQPPRDGSLEAALPDELPGEMACDADDPDDHFDYE